MKILVFDDDVILGQEFKKVIEGISDFSVELSLNCPTLYEGDITLFDLIFLDYVRPGQKDTISTMFFLDEKNLVEKTIVYSSMFENESFEILKPYSIFSFIPRDSSSLFLEQLIFYFNKQQQIPDLNINYSNLTDVVIVKKNNFYIKISLKDILHVEVDKKNLIYYVADTSYIVRNSLSNFILKHGDLFIRIHGKHAINKRSFLKLDYKDQVIYLENGTVLSLSKYYRTEFYELFSIMS